MQAATGKNRSLFSAIGAKAAASGNGVRREHFWNRRQSEKIPSQNDPVKETAAEPVSDSTLAMGSAGKLARYDVEDRTAVLLMAIVAEKINKPLNQIRFISIREAE